ncbi:MAG TPA: response regulator [Anaerolineales bacterium]|nr:response regulator [Anaerolineales bacterium]HRQ93332.1 response regulator [Anaerolineales bacterium]
MPTVLVVDDQPELLEMMNFGLQLAGYQVHTASNGAAALRAARQCPPDLVILDFNLPGPSGASLCAHLKQLSKQAPILLISGMATAQQVHSTLQAGAKEYLRKPFELNQLLARADVLTNRSAATAPFC